MGSVNLADFIKAYDVRGLVGSQLTAEVMAAIGSAFAHVVLVPEGHQRLVVGHDMRQSSPELAEAFARAVRSHGIDVLWIGLCASDQLYFASGHLRCPGAMITASHNPATYNGLKLCRSNAVPVGMDTGLAEIRTVAQAHIDHGEPVAAPAGGEGSQTVLDITGDYVSYLYSLVPTDGLRELRVVLDAGNGMAGLSGPAVLDSELSPATMIGLYLELDGTFPHHEPNPLDPANLVDLGAAVVQHDADLGLAFDGDADRCFVVDERGRPVSASAISALVALEEIAAEVARGVPVDQVSVVHNSVTSVALSEAVEAAGATPVVSQVGHVYMKQQMARHQAVFGAEHSGHYYFRDFWYADTGMLMALRVLSALGSAPGEPSLSELVGPYEAYHQSGEVNLVVHDVDAAMERVQAWAMAVEDSVTVDRLDGLALRSQHAHGQFWSVSLRSSNTEPLLRLNVEASSESLMTTVREGVQEALRASPSLSDGSGPSSTTSPA